MATQGALGLGKEEQRKKGNRGGQVRARDPLGFQGAGRVGLRGGGPPFPAERSTAAWRQEAASAAWAATVREKGEERGCPEGSTRQGCELFQFSFF